MQFILMKKIDILFRLLKSLSKGKKENKMETKITKESYYYRRVECTYIMT